MLLPDVPAELATRLDEGRPVIWREPITMPTYEPALPDRYPQFLNRRVYQGSSGRVYPLPMVDRIATEPVDRAWDAVHLENEFVRLVILPELGGRIHIGYDKVADYHFFYRNRVIKPALVGLAGPWLAGGVEFNWPQHHRPATYLPMTVAIESDEDSVTVWCSDHDPMTRMKGMHGLRLRSGSALIELAVRLHNRTSDRHTFLWWANAAVSVDDDYQSFFPTDVHWVADHARRAITSYPIADRPYYGVDYPARPGQDRLDWSKNIPVPTSYMVTSTGEDFFGGYDHGVGAGFVHVADRHIAPGKKQWTWGYSAFGDAWIAHLTDEDGPYVELMAGAYTDNQPDFTFIEPGETKTFSQFWYPYQQLGVVHHATTEAAVHLSVADAAIHLGVAVPAALPGATILLDQAGAEIGRWTADLAPGAPFRVALPTDLGSAQGLRIRVGSVIDWVHPSDGPGPEPARAVEPPLPPEVGTADELYRIAVHLEQYRHPTRAPEPYLNELLDRDPGDARANEMVARRRLAAGQYEDALVAIDRALARLRRYNSNPESGSASMVRGLVLVRLGRLAEADAAFAKAAWNEAQRHAAAFERARLHARMPDGGDRAQHLVTELLRNEPDDARLLALEAVLRLRRGDEAGSQRAVQAALALDRLDTLAIVLGGGDLDDAGLLVDVAADFASFGESARALELLDRAARLPGTAAGNRAPIALYRAALVAARAGDDPVPWLIRARAADRDLAFPCGLDDLDALTFAVGVEPEDAAAHALLGTLLYDSGRRAEALEHWRDAIARDPDPVTLRNAAVATVTVEADHASALELYERAIRLAPADSRLWYESDHLLGMTGATARTRLDRLPPAALERDDLAIVVAELLVDDGQHAEAVALLSSRPFQPWEGGEGRAIAAWERAAGADVTPPSSLGEVRGADTTPRAIREDGTIDYFATSLPELLMFDRPDSIPVR